MFPSSSYLVVVNKNRECTNATLPSIDSLAFDRNVRSEDVMLAFGRNELFTHQHPSFLGILRVAKKVNPW